MKKPRTEILRTFFHSLWVAVVVAATMAATGHRGSILGFGIGALISLFSLYSLGVCVPALFHSGATRRAPALLNVLLVTKLPIYALGLYFAARMGASAAFAAFCGCTLVPGVISLREIGNALALSDRRWRSAAALQAPPALFPAVEHLTRHVETVISEAQEMPTLSPIIRAAREGAA